MKEITPVMCNREPQELAPAPLQPIPPGPVPQAPPQRERRMIEITIDGQPVSVPEGSTILEAARKLGIDTPTLCFLESLTPVNVCRVCVVEMEGSRTLVPACSRKVEAKMAIKTDSERVRLSRKMVLEFLASSVDVSTAPAIRRHTWNVMAQSRSALAATPLRWSSPSRSITTSTSATTQNAFSATSAWKPAAWMRRILLLSPFPGAAFPRSIATEFQVPLPESACVYCGNCIGVCPTGALMFKSEYDMRQAGTWDESRQEQTTTICPYCGVGCNLTVHEQDGEIVKVTSPLDHPVTHGNLCIKGRFGWQFVQIEPAEAKSK